MPASNIRNAFIVLEADELEKLHFQFMPRQLTVSGSAQWASQTPIGRSEPYRSYEHSTAQQYAFDLVFQTSTQQGDNGSPDDVLQKVNWLRSLRYPEVANNLVLGPPVCRLIVGDSWINARVVAESVNVTFEAPYEASDIAGVVRGPLAAHVSLVFVEVNLYPQPSSVIRAGVEHTMPPRGRGGVDTFRT